MKLAQFLLLCSSTLAVKVTQVDTMGDALAETEADLPSFEEEVE